MMDQCIVCQMAAGQMEGAVLYHDREIITILDHNPINPGHILICPVQHYQDFDDVPDALLGRLLGVTRMLYRVLKTTYQSDGLSFMQNNGTFNELKHYHLHLFPRYRTNPFRLVMKESNILSVTDLRREMARIQRTPGFDPPREPRRPVGQLN